MAFVPPTAGTLASVRAGPRVSRDGRVSDAIETAGRRAARRRATRRELAPFRGLGTWVDIYNWGPWLDPELTARRMAATGVQTAYVETTNFRRRVPFVFRKQLGRLLNAAHSRGVRVVAWTLPGLKNPSIDFRRIKAAIKFKTRAGERFDGFVVNLESKAVKDISKRNRRAIRLSERVKRFVPLRYSLGTVVVDPVHASYWPRFPYRQVSRIYDVIMPMSFWSFREIYGPRGVRKFVFQNIRRIRRVTRGRVPIHVPGGLASETTMRGTRAFVSLLRRKHVLGGSMYDFPLTSWEQLEVLARLRR